MEKNTRVYLYHWGEQVLTGVLTEDIISEIEEGRNLLKTKDNWNGTWEFETSLPPVHDEQNPDINASNVYVRAGLEDIEFSYYGPEGWEYINLEKYGKSIFDSSLLRRLVRDMDENSIDEKSLPQKDEIIENILHPNDVDSFEEALSDYEKRHKER